jgi:Flp pilus assembly protein CpaB
MRRSSLLWWTATVALALITALVVSSATATATRGAHEWGASTRVWVVARHVEAGDVFADGDARVVRRPNGVVPKGALNAVSSPIGEATRVTVEPGEVVLVARLAGRGAHGVAALVPPGYRAVAVPYDDTSPTVRTGDRVDVLATFDVGDTSSSDGAATALAPSFAVAADAEVLAVAARAVTIAVDAHDAPRVAFALAKAAVTLAVRSPNGRLRSR